MISSTVFVESESYFHKFQFSYWFKLFHVKFRSTATLQNIQSQIRLLETRFKNKLVGPSLASFYKKYPPNMLCRPIIAIKLLTEWRSTNNRYKLYDNITMQQLTSTTSNLPIRNAKTNFKVGPPKVILCE